MSDQFVIKRAERKQARLRLAFQGPSGSGKTATSLLVAKGIVEGLVEHGVIAHSLDSRIGVIDTERQSASLYADMALFDTIELEPPYSADRYKNALHALEAAGYPVIIIDSFSHAWAGPGGMLSQADQFGDWKNLTPVQDELVDAILRSPAHIILTMRSKTAWVIEKKENSRGKEVNTPRRVGLAPVQRPGVEYEFTTLLALDTDQNKVTVLKDRTQIFGEIDTVLPRLRIEHGKTLVKWLMAGAPMAPEDTIGAQPEQKLVAITEAAERTFAGAPTVPDLARMFDEAWKKLLALKGELPANTLGPYQQRLVAAKDKRKAEFGTAPVLDPNVEYVSPDAVAKIEEMLMAGRLTLSQLQAEFDVARAALLPRAAWGDVVKWIVRVAAAEGYEVTALPYPDLPAETPEPNLQDKARQIMDSAGSKQAGGSMFDDEPPAHSSHPFADMADDIPY